jgi:hypothetical protein
LHVSSSTSSRARVSGQNTGVVRLAIRIFSAFPLILTESFSIWGAYYSWMSLMLVNTNSVAFKILRPNLIASLLVGFIVCIMHRATLSSLIPRRLVKFSDISAY